MTTIDSDAPVLETPRTWDFLEDHEAKYRPMIVARIEGEQDTSLQGSAISQYWIVSSSVTTLDRGCR